jgi:predicted RNase H-like HicB family nuclease
MQFAVEIDREDDGRWIAELPELHGVLAYGNGAKDAIARAKALAVCVLADRLKHRETDRIEN